VVPLPIAVHNEMLGIDRKFRLAQNEEALKLTSSEKKALLFIDLFYSEKPIWQASEWSGPTRRIISRWGVVGRRRNSTRKIKAVSR
jgi:hypothetical protein